MRGRGARELPLCVESIDLTGIAGFGMIWFGKGKNLSQTPLIFGEMNVKWIEFS